AARGIEQRAACYIEADALDELRRAGAETRAREPTETAHREAGGRREALEIPVGVRTARHLLGKPRQAWIIDALRGQVGRELALSAGADAENDVAARDRQRDGAAVVRLDHGEREIHPGGDPGRGPDPAILDMNRIVVDIDRRTEAAQLVDVAPVGGGAT